MDQKTLIIFIGSLITLLGCNLPHEPGTPAHIKSVTMSVDEDRIFQAENEPENWLSYGRNYYEDRYSPLNQINSENVNRLGLAWSYDIGLRGGIEATPLVVDGIIYITGPWSTLYALNARTGEEIWRVDPDVPRLHGLKACCDVVNRGAAMYKGKIYVGTLDGRLLALDASTGETDWSVHTFDPGTDYTITGAPRVVQGKVIIGNGGAEYGVRGYISAYNAMTGDLEWRTYTIPGDPSLPFESAALEMAAETWSGEWWEAGGGGTVWDAMAYDPNLDLLYVGTGNGSPWSRNLRSPGGGDNLFLSSILALNPSNGELVWYYQTTPGDHWDYTATQPLLLADLTINGELQKVIMQAPKNGFFYVIDRETGEFISAEPYVTVTWADGVDPNTGRTNERSAAVYESEPAFVQPGPFGGHNWQPMAFNYTTQYVYLPVHERSALLSESQGWQYQPGQMNLGVNWGAGDVEPTGALLAWDPIEQKEAWRVPLAHWWNGGVLTTAGELTFHGGGDGRFVAYQAESGDILWETSTGLGIIGSPVSYQIDDEQYITIAAGWGGAAGRTGSPAGEASKFQQSGKIFTFKLDNEGNMPSLTPRVEKISVPNLDLPSTQNIISHGGALFNNYCVRCHGAAGNSQGAMPNLQKMSQERHDVFNHIVLDGIFEPRGMPSFAELLSIEDVRSIQSYLVSEIKKTVDESSNSASSDK